MNNKFHGVFPALLTPYDKNGFVNCETIEALVEHNLKKGVTGFYVGGSTSEAFLLSMDERKTILETAVKAAAGKATIIAHVGCVSTEHTAELARHAAKVGADAVSAVPPFYYGFSFNEIKNHYMTLADESGLPVIIYNFVANGGSKLSQENFEVFLKDPRFLGVKHTSADMFLLERLKGMRDDVVVFNGFDEMFISGLAAGADGGIGSTYNFMAEKFVKIETLFRANKIDEAREEQKKANNIIAALIQVGVIPGCKAILRSQGFDMGEARRPFSPLTAEQNEMLLKVYSENV
ncbi:MAG: N-acetylneuraminate lyase [Ruminococcaceae bacterium]|nr:N-acetylneuraminate lyase [Oscillospiraceae bacterium]